MEPICSICGYHFENHTKVKQHYLAEHYDYVLSQCNGDKELLKEWVSKQLTGLENVFGEELN